MAYETKRHPPNRFAPHLQLPLAKADVTSKANSSVMSMDWIGYENRFKSNPNIELSLLTGYLNRINQITRIQIDFIYLHYYRESWHGV